MLIVYNISMETRVLKYFLTVVQTGNISRAAEKLHITQPTLSRQLQDLEKSMGTKLFNRGKKEITLTNNGVMFAQSAKQIIQMINKTRQQINQSNIVPTGIISIGLVETTISEWFFKTIKSFRAMYPQIVINIYNGDGDDLREKLDDNFIDLAFLIEPVESAKYHANEMGPLEKWGIIVKKSDILANKNSVNKNDLYNRPIILSRRSIVTESILDSLEINKEKLNVIGTHNLLTNAIPFIKEYNTMTIAVSGALSIRPDSELKFIPFEEKLESKHILVWRKNVALSLHARLLLDFLHAKK
ncbi:LysR family transcriptional regulator [Leuconostoc pseudomesenteroides]|uniref:LysR family transcriptional regulator n=1 Tax=Leuconostoc pseudomesenteroides TaxID=33968 RepID=UPI0040350647